MLSNAWFYCILCLGLNIVIGYAGLLDLGYAAFFAVGAYTTGILTSQFGVNFWLTIPVAVIFSSVAGIIIGGPTLRLRTRLPGHRHPRDSARSSASAPAT